MILPSVSEREMTDGRRHNSNMKTEKTNHQNPGNFDTAQRAASDREQRMQQLSKQIIVGAFGTLLFDYTTFSMGVIQFVNLFLNAILVHSAL
jgi:hypothetical protein